MCAIANALRRAQPLALLSIAAGLGALAVGCRPTDNVIGSLLGNRALGASSGAPNADAVLSGLAGTSGEGATSGGGGDALQPAISAGGDASSGASNGAAGVAGASNVGGVGGSSNCVPDGTGGECIATGCGDGVESSTESCDDGNNVTGDGCSAGCHWEPPQGTLQGPLFWSPVAMSGDTIVVGPFVFRLHGSVWALEAKLNASAPGGGPDPYDDGGFANAVAISGNTIAIGAQTDSEAAQNAGAVHIFQRTGSTWVWQQKLVPTLPDGTRDAIEQEQFGAQLAFSGDTLAVGAPVDDDQGGVSGSVYVFRRAATGFAPEAKLVATLPDGVPDGGQYFLFGEAVSLSGDTLVAGSSGVKVEGIATGAAYVFERSGSVWSPRARLLPTLPDGASDATDWDRFGSAVAVAGDKIVVGSPASNDFTGCAYVFGHGANGWAAEFKLQAPMPPPADGYGVGRFGGSIAISSAADLILIGSIGDTHPGAYMGTGYVFKFDGSAWVGNGELILPIPSGGDSPFSLVMGSWVAASADALLVGAGLTSYLYRPKNGTWDARLVMRVPDQ